MHWKIRGPEHLTGGHWEAARLHVINRYPRIVRTPNYRAPLLPWTIWSPNQSKYLGIFLCTKLHSPCSRTLASIVQRFFIFRIGTARNPPLCVKGAYMRPRVDMILGAYRVCKYISTCGQPLPGRELTCRTNDNVRFRKRISLL